MPRTNKGTLCAFACSAQLILLAVDAGAAPELETRPPQTARASVPFVVNYIISWAGEPNAYVVAPPALEEFPWGTARVRESRTSRSAGRNQVTYTLEFVAPEPGEHALPVIEFAYFPPEAALPPRASAEAGPPSRSDYPTLRTDPFPVEVRPKRTFSWMSGGLGALFFLAAIAALIALWIRARRRNRLRTSVHNPVIVAESPLQRARRFRMDGDLYGYYQALIAAMADLPETEHKSMIRGRLDERANAVGYKNERPSAVELETDEREVARLIQGVTGEPPQPQPRQ